MRRNSRAARGATLAIGPALARAFTNSTSAAKDGAPGAPASMAGNVADPIKDSVPGAAGGGAPCELSSCQKRGGCFGGSCCLA